MVTSRGATRGWSAEHRDGLARSADRLLNRFAEGTRVAFSSPISAADPTMSLATHDRVRSSVISPEMIRVAASFPAFSSGRHEAAGCLTVSPASWHSVRSCTSPELPPARGPAGLGAGGWRWCHHIGEVVHGMTSSAPRLRIFNSHRGRYRTLGFAHLTLSSTPSASHEGQSTRVGVATCWRSRPTAAERLGAGFENRVTRSARRI
jgi:hypothetical protein